MENPFERDGEPVDVTRIEFDLLDSGTWRWTAWSDGQRLISATVPHRKINKILKVTALLVHTMAEERSADAPE